MLNQTLSRPGLSKVAGSEHSSCRDDREAETLDKPRILQGCSFGKRQFGKDPSRNPRGLKRTKAECRNYIYNDRNVAIESWSTTVFVLGILAY